MNKNILIPKSEKKSKVPQKMFFFVFFYLNVYQNFISGLQFVQISILHPLLPTSVEQNLLHIKCFTQ